MEQYLGPFTGVTEAFSNRKTALPYTGNIHNVFVQRSAIARTSMPLIPVQSERDTLFLSRAEVRQLLIAAQQHASGWVHHKLQQSV